MPAGSSAVSLATMIAVILEDAAVEITREAQLSDFSETTDMRTHIRTQSDWGEERYAEVELPEDFCRLAALRLRGWGATLNEENPGDALRAGICEEAPDWLAMRPMRPWLRLSRLEHTPTLRFGPPTGADPLEAAYIPIPRFDTDDEWLIGLDPALLPRLIDRLTLILRSQND